MNNQQVITSAQGGVSEFRLLLHEWVLDDKSGFLVEAHLFSESEAGWKYHECWPVGCVDHYTY